MCNVNIQPEEVRIGLPKPCHLNFCIEVVEGRKAYKASLNQITKTVSHSSPSLWSS